MAENEKREAERRENYRRAQAHMIALDLDRKITETRYDIARKEGDARMLRDYLADLERAKAEWEAEAETRRIGGEQA